MAALAFFDSNVPLYLLSNDIVKAAKAEDLLVEGGVVSVQVLNEIVAVARRKLAAPWQAVDDTLTALRQVCRVAPLAAPTHDKAVTLAKRYGFTIYDATIVASALEAGCSTLYSEDFQHGQKLEGLTISNPFR